MKLQRVSGGCYRGSDMQTGRLIMAKEGDTIEVSGPEAQYLQRTFPHDWVPAEAPEPVAEPNNDRMVGVQRRRRGRPPKGGA